MLGRNKYGKKFEIPDIYKYEDIIKAAKTGNLIIFVGAGISMLLGLPSWKGYAQEILEDAIEKGVIDSELYEKLKEEDPKKILTICKMLFDEKKSFLSRQMRFLSLRKMRNIKQYMRSYTQ